MMTCMGPPCEAYCVQHFGYDAMVVTVGLGAVSPLSISGYLPQHSYHVYQAIAHCIFQAVSWLYRGGCKGNLGGVPFCGLLCNYGQLFNPSTYITMKSFVTLF